MKKERSEYQADALNVSGAANRRALPKKLSSTSAARSEFAMGLRPTHGDESALPRFIDSERVATRLSTGVQGDLTTVSGLRGGHFVFRSLGYMIDVT